MQIDNLIFFIFMLILIPLMIFITSDVVFFIVISFILFINSLNVVIETVHNFNKNIYFEKKSDDRDEDIESIENIININLKKFGVGTKVVKFLIVLLFYLYCFFVSNNVFIKSIDIIICSYLGIKFYNNIKKNKNSNVVVSYRSSKEKILDISINIIILIFLSNVICVRFLMF